MCHVPLVSSINVSRSHRHFLGCMDRHRWSPTKTTTFRSKFSEAYIYQRSSLRDVGRSATLLPH